MTRENIRWIDLRPRPVRVVENLDGWWRWMMVGWCGVMVMTMGFWAWALVELGTPYAAPYAAQQLTCDEYVVGTDAFYECVTGEPLDLTPVAEEGV